MVYLSYKVVINFKKETFPAFYHSEGSTFLQSIEFNNMEVICFRIHKNSWSILLYIY